MITKERNNLPDEKIYDRELILDTLNPNMKKCFCCGKWVNTTSKESTSSRTFKDDLFCDTVCLNQYFRDRNSRDAGY